MKRLLILTAFLIATYTSFGQTQYTITQVSYRKLVNGQLVKAPYKAVSKTTTAYLYSNALNITGEGETYYKFARKVYDDGNEQRWNALDAGGHECEVFVKNYGTYSTIVILWVKTGQVVCYQTL